MKKNRYVLLILFCTLGTICGFYLPLKKWIKYHRRPALTVCGFFVMHDGMGRQSASLIRSLKDEVFVGLEKTRKFELTSVPQDLRTIASTKRKHLGKVVIFEDLLQNKQYQKIAKDFKREDPNHIYFAYSMTESTKIPDTWVYILNRYFDGVLVPDSFLVDVYRNSGVTKPIFVLPLNVDFEPFFQLREKQRLESPFIFANFSSGIERKNLLKTIQAFDLAFHGKENVQLHINCKLYDPNTKAALEEEIKRRQATNIFLTTHAFTEEEYISQFRNIHCLLNLSKGEGFSIQPREALAAGIPVIVTNNTAQKTIAQSGYALSIPSYIAQPAYFESLNGYHGQFYDFELQDAINAMKELYENYVDFHKQALAARSWVEQYTNKALKPYQKTLIHPTQILLGKNNQIHPDGILETTSQKLFKKYQNIFFFGDSHEPIQVNI